MLEALNLLSFNIIARLSTWHCAFFPELLTYHLSSWDLRYKRNVERMKAMLQKILDERRARKTKKLTEFDDLLEIMINDDLFKHDDESIKDEMLGFFFAGSLTT